MNKNKGEEMLFQSQTNLKQINMDRLSEVCMIALTLLA